MRRDLERPRGREAVKSGNEEEASRADRTPASKPPSADPGWGGSEPPGPESVDAEERDARSVRRDRRDAEGSSPEVTERLQQKLVELIVAGAIDGDRPLQLQLFRFMLVRGW